MSEALANVASTGMGGADTPSSNGASAGMGAQTTGPATTSSNSTDWTQGLNEDLRGYVQNKGFKDPTAVLDSYRNLEKLMGAPKERLLKLPEKDDDPAWNDVYERLGRPKEAKEYQIEVPKEFGDEKAAEWAKNTFHKLGIPKKQAEAFVKEWNKFAESGHKDQAQAQQAMLSEQDAALKKEWGAAYDQNLGVAKRAAKEFGMDAETIDKLEGALGFSGVIKLMHNIGAKLGEDSFVGSDSKSKGFGALAPEAAKNRIQALRGDPEFVRRYTNGDLGAKEEMEKLHRWAYGE